MTPLIKAIIVDDEPANQKTLDLLIKTYQPSIQIAAVCDHADLAYAAITSHQPDLVFLDIKMPGKNGFELLEMFPNARFSVVFVTGFDEFAVKAFEFNAVDYLLKPIDVEKFKVSIQKIYDRVLREKKQALQPAHLADTVDMDQKLLKKVLFHKGEKVFVIPVDDIISIVSADGVVEVQTRTMDKMVSSKTLLEFEEILEGNPGFIRINKSNIINTRFILSYTKGNTCEIMMNNGNTFEVSRRKKGEILKLLDR